jgi:hypothetical protein
MWIVNEAAGIQPSMRVDYPANKTEAGIKGLEQTAQHTGVSF